MHILLMDDHSLFREGMRHVLRQLTQEDTIFEASGCKAGLIIAAENTIDLLLLDLHMPEVDGFAVLALFREQYPLTSVVVLSASEDWQDARRALDTGAVGYIPKSATSQVMLGALHLVLSGGIYVPPIILQEMQRQHTAPLSAPILQAIAAPTKVPQEVSKLASSALTVRQLEVLCLLAQGKSNKEIGRDLNMAEGTVKIHVTAIFKALSVVNRTQAVLMAKKLGLAS